jgi:predicted SAM-dependent methyltransferase
MLCDFSRGLPFPAGGFSGIFCEHVLEHFDLEQGLDLLKECFRVLRPRGCLRLIVPDGETIIRSYLESPAELVARRNNGSPFAIDAVNSYFRQRYEHQYIYDWPMLVHQLEAAGFGEVRRVAYGQAVAVPELLLDDETYAWESLYVEAVKPF